MLTLLPCAKRHLDLVLLLRWLANFQLHPLRLHNPLQSALGGLIQFFLFLKPTKPIVFSFGEFHNRDKRRLCSLHYTLDPPYRPLTETAAFTSYNENGFGDKEQIELAKFIEAISRRKALVVTSNSDPKNVREDDNFFDKLYQKFSIKRVSASRMINSNAKKRGAINELLISNVAGLF